MLDLELPGVGTMREYAATIPPARSRPRRRLHGRRRPGQEGLEAAFDHWLKGEPGSKQVLQDRRGQVDDVELLRAARPGRDLRTSIDLRLQYLAYRELKAVVGDSGARSGSVVVLDPRTGEVLAMVNQPSHNPNADRRSIGPKTTATAPSPTSSSPARASSRSSWQRRSRAATTARGRRSTPGAISINDRVIADPQDLGRIGLTTVLAKSSNVGAARVALTREPKAISDVLTRSGSAGSPKRIPRRVARRLDDPKHWSTVGQVTLSYGYGVAVTTLQLARATPRLRPTACLRPVSLLALDEAPPGERVISADTAADLTSMLEAVVSPEGTGYRAAVRNFHVAGKTGTTQKAGVGGYDADRHGAIFGGFAPATDPRLVVVVMIDEPQGAAYHGGDIAAPVFANIVSGALRVLAVPPDALPRRR